MQDHELVSEPSRCCGCGACLNICPCDAITMQADSYGFCYPHIDGTRCIDCRACLRVCAYQKGNTGNVPLATYAAASKDHAQMQRSSSGGVFATLATQTLNAGGTVFGVALVRQAEQLTPIHLGISTVAELPALQGSKYVQSDTGDCYRQAKALLAQGKRVLFSGTPCQIAGLQGYLGKPYQTLTTVDVICHGVPNAQLFGDYLQTLPHKRDTTLTWFVFRDKTKGWSLVARQDWTTPGGKVYKSLLPSGASSYYTLFLESHTYRDNCYSCPYATQRRVGDITLGDYWGIEQAHPELLESPDFAPQRGISCVLVNTAQGEALLAEARTKLALVASEFDKVAQRNGQLREPSHVGARRDAVLQLYAQQGYPAVEAYFRKHYRKQMIIATFKSKVPQGLKRYLKAMLRRLKG